MARHVTITEEQILEAARAVFLEEGFSAQTAKIAQKAGVSEGSIFKRFQTKEELFYTALQIPYPPAWHAEIESLIGVGDVKTNLNTIALSILHQSCTTLPRVITTLGSRVKSVGEGPFHGMPDPPPVRDARVISEFAAREIALGRLRSVDPPLFGKMLLGSLMHYVFVLFASKQIPTDQELKTLAEGTVELLWYGIAP